MPKHATLARVRLHSAVMLAALFASLLLLLSRTAPATLVKQDFTPIYAAAQMIRQGEGARIYNIADQARAQMELGAPRWLIFNHPPFELLAVLPFTCFSLERAFLLWSALNAAAMAAAAMLLRDVVAPNEDYAVVGMFFLFFAPVFFSFTQGQPGGILLAIYTGAFVLLRRRQDFSAGLLLALAMAKFHFVLPFAAIMLLHRQWRFLGGLALGSFGLCLASLPICGWRVLVAYPYLVIHADVGIKTQQIPQIMPNLRGLIALLGGGVEATLAAMPLLLAPLFFFAWRAFRRGSDIAVAAAMATGLVAVFHVYGHDLTILLLPLAVSAAYLRGRLRQAWPLAATALLLWCPVGHILFFNRYAWMGLPVIGFVLALWVEAYRTREGAPEGASFAGPAELLEAGTLRLTP